MRERVRFYQASTSELYGKVQETPQREPTPFLAAFALCCRETLWLLDRGQLTARPTASTPRTVFCFNHEGPTRGETFVTRKITRAVAAIKIGRQQTLYLWESRRQARLGARARFVEGMWRILQQSESDDYVLATGETHSVREFVEKAFAEIGINIEWRERVLEKSERGCRDR